MPSPAGQAIFARKSYQKAHNLLAALERVEIESGDTNHCSALRFGRGRAAMHLETERCHLRAGEKEAAGPRRAKIQRIVRVLGLDQAAAGTENLAAHQRSRALACMNPHRGPGDVHHQVVDVARSSTRRITDGEDSGGLIEF